MIYYVTAFGASSAARISIFGPWMSSQKLVAAYGCFNFRQEQQILIAYRWPSVMRKFCQGVPTKWALCTVSSGHFKSSIGWWIYPVYLTWSRIHLHSLGEGVITWWCWDFLTYDILIFSVKPLPSMCALEPLGNRSWLTTGTRSEQWTVQDRTGVWSWPIWTRNLGHACLVRLYRSHWSLLRPCPRHKQSFWGFLNLYSSSSTSKITMSTVH